MNPKIIFAILVALAIMAMSWIIAGSRVRASADTDKAEILALNQRLTDSFDKRDVDGVMSCYMNANDMVFFEDTTPLQFKGTSALRTDFQGFIEGTSQIHAEMEGVSVVVSGDLAAAHYVMPFSWTDESGSYSERAHYTQVLKRVNGKWLIWHEHFSVPFDPAPGRPCGCRTPCLDEFTAVRGRGGLGWLSLLRPHSSKTRATPSRVRLSFPS